MENRHLPHWVLVRLVAAMLAITGCTRAASTAPPSDGSAAGSPGPLTGQQATMEAVRSALLTQTAQSRIALPTAKPTTEVPPTAVPTATITMTPVVEVPTDTAVPSGGTPAATAVPTAAPTKVTGGSGFTEYTVLPGEWVYSIARKFGVDPQAIIDLNNLVDPYTLYPGDVIKIPSGGDAPVPPSDVGAPSESGTTYTVQLGDYVSSIAAQFGVTSDAIVSANNLTYPYTLYPGQVLTIP